MRTDDGNLEERRTVTTFTADGTPNEETTVRNLSDVNGFGTSSCPIPPNSFVEGNNLNQSPEMRNRNMFLTEEPMSKQKENLSANPAGKATLFSIPVPDYAKQLREKIDNICRPK